MVYHFVKHIGFDIKADSLEQAKEIAEAIDDYDDEYNSVKDIAMDTMLDAIDDALDVFPTHGMGGIVGTVLTGIFIQEGLIAGTWDGFIVFLFHLLAIAIVFTYTFAMSWLGYKLIDRFIPMRVSPYSEKVGLDFSQHDEHYGLAHIGERELAEYEEHLREKLKIED